mmetsp:Transcript_14852/g.27847  ORF Transcript_14852/g.27847 Transcript_14852/m.27847 type:complete len:259 (+) Transcript_14852:50-826(+)
MAHSRNSFDRVFPRHVEKTEKTQQGEVPSVHELFTMAMREELPIPHFAEALRHLHDIHLTGTAARLLASVDAGSGRLPFSQFQRALQEDTASRAEAGRPNVFADQAKAIIADNAGSPLPQDKRGDHSRPRTDISNDDFVKAGLYASKVQAQGPFSGSAVLPTNDASAGNPLAQRTARHPVCDDEASSAREMTQTATRMFVGGELDRSGYEQYLTRMGIVLAPESELQRLIINHDRAGASFASLCRAVMAALDSVPSTA